jgi:hypothetical protein
MQPSKGWQRSLCCARTRCTGCAKNERTGPGGAGCTRPSWTHLGPIRTHDEREQLDHVMSLIPTRIRTIRSLSPVDDGWIRAVCVQLTEQSRCECWPRLGMGSGPLGDHQSHDHGWVLAPLRPSDPTSAFWPHAAVLCGGQRKERCDGWAALGAEARRRLDRVLIFEGRDMFWFEADPGWVDVRALLRDRVMPGPSTRHDQPGDRRGGAAEDRGGTAEDRV